MNFEVRHTLVCAATIAVLSGVLFTLIAIRAQHGAAENVDFNANSMHPVSGIRHIVRSGETVETIGSMYQSEAAPIRDLNGLRDGDQPAIGAAIIVPLRD